MSDAVWKKDGRTVKSIEKKLMPRIIRYGEMPCVLKIFPWNCEVKESKIM